jgi:3-carboxy-cis,cis-muconate cycloisomerase
MPGLNWPTLKKKRHMPERIDALFSTTEMADVFSLEAHIRGMLAFEAALALAEARAGIIPQESAKIIADSCRVELFDVAALYREAEVAGTPTILLVRMLTLQVEGDAKKFVHWGATSQDAIDTAMMLQMRDGIDLLVNGLLGVCEECKKQTEQHRYTLLAGRTLLQHAVPITFGLKAARWLSLAVRQVNALRERRERSLAVQLGGAAGTLASLGDKGIKVLDFLADELRLPVPDLPWHSERDRIGEIAGTLGVVAGAMAKIASDVALLTQTEIGEASEEAIPGKGGSSAMPQKHNPVDAAFAIASARLTNGEVSVLLSAMTQEHERAVGGWQAEWVALPNLFRYTSGAVEHVREMIRGLKVDPARMSANIELTQGLIMAESLTMALAPHVGRPEAQRIVKALCERAVRSGVHLREVVLEEEAVHSVLSLEEIDRALDPSAYLGSTNVFIDRALASYPGAKAFGGGGTK